jgi:hypothetical protein
VLQGPVSQPRPVTASFCVILRDTLPPDGVALKAIRSQLGFKLRQLFLSESNPLEGPLESSIEHNFCVDTTDLYSWVLPYCVCVVGGSMLQDN